MKEITLLRKTQNKPILGTYNPKMIKYMKNFYIAEFGALLSLLMAIMLSTSCGTTKFIPVEGEKESVINYIDSLRIRDSIVVVPIERTVDIVPQYDTLRMETSLAKAEAYFDTTFHTLRGSIENKEQVIYRDRWRERVVEVHDTLRVKEPVPYEVVKEKRVVPKWAWISLIASIIETLILGWLIYFLFIKKFMF